MHAILEELLYSRREELEDLCRRLEVKELRVFGSATTSAFDPERSDVDIIADFDFPDAPGIATRYMELAEGLERLFGRPIDLVTRPSPRNQVFKRVLEETSQPVYAH